MLNVSEFKKKRKKENIPIRLFNLEIACNFKGTF